jgi:hypothetical protein
LHLVAQRVLPKANRSSPDVAEPDDELEFDEELEDELDDRPELLELDDELEDLPELLELEELDDDELDDRPELLELDELEEDELDDELELTGSLVPPQAARATINSARGTCRSRAARPVSVDCKVAFIEDRDESCCMGARASLWILNSVWRHSANYWSRLAIPPFARSNVTR